MHAPLLQPAPRASAPTAGIEAFVVVREGVFGGRAFGVGEVLLCRGEARNGDETVLVALGHGRPRLGTRRNGRWLGDAGEPCAPERWRPAGRLVGRLRSGGGRQTVELFHGEVVADLPAAPVQLSLFAA
jgi:hypothetical protein